MPAVCFGAYALGGGYWGAPDDGAATRAIHAALDHGMTAFDTAPVYGLGHSEAVLGAALEGRRDEAVLMTKVGVRWDGDGDYTFDMPEPGGRRVPARFDGTAASVRLELERSLERLRTDHVDLIQVHGPDPRTPVGETVGSLADLVAEGKARAVGVSNLSVPQLDESVAALGDRPLASVQPQFSLLERAIERDLLPWSIERRVGVLAYAPLDQGLLTGRIRDDRAFGKGEGRPNRPSYQPAIRRKINRTLDEVVAPIAARHDATVAQVVLAWTAAREGITSLLVGARSEAQVVENAGAARVTLSDSEWTAIDVAFRRLAPSRGAALGRRVRAILGRLGRR